MRAGAGGDRRPRGGGERSRNPARGRILSYERARAIAGVRRLSSSLAGGPPIPEPTTRELKPGTRADSSRAADDRGGHTRVGARRPRAQPIAPRTEHTKEL